MLPASITSGMRRHWTASCARPVTLTGLTFLIVPPGSPEGTHVLRGSTAADPSCLQCRHAKASLPRLQDIYTDGLFHPTVTSSIATYVYQSNFSSSAILQQPASMQANLTCTCGQFFDNPCRMEERAVRHGQHWESSACCLPTCGWHVIWGPLPISVTAAALQFTLPDSRVTSMLELPAEVD